MFVLVCMPMSSESIHAGVITAPNDLNPGDQFRAVFVTNNTSQAVHTSIDYYNATVDSRAGLLSFDGETDLEWKAIVSTQTVSARENIAANFDGGVPFYRLDGVRIANDNQDLWDGSINVPINISESNQTRLSLVWTGTTIFGTSEPQNFLGRSTLATPFPLPLAIPHQHVNSFEVGRAGGSLNSSSSWISHSNNALASYRNCSCPRVRS